MSTIRLEQFFEELDREPRRVPIRTLCDRLERLDLGDGSLDPFVRFANDGYRRNLVRLGPGYAALLLCWRPGQSSPVHDHQGSACALRVVRGTGLETRYVPREGGGLAESGRKVYRVGDVCGTYDSDIHTIVNDSDEEDLVTLHVYTPPMLRYHTYCLQSGDVTECADQEVLAERRRQVG